jgi:hypothetical protein
VETRADKVRNRFQSIARIWEQESAIKIHSNHAGITSIPVRKSDANATSIRAPALTEIGSYIEICKRELPCQVKKIGGLSNQSIVIERSAREKHNADAF